VDLSQFTSTKGAFRKKFSIDSSQRILLFVGRLHELKGVNFLIEAFAHLVKEFEDLRLVIVGPDDGYMSDLRRLASSLDVTESVLFTGPLYESDKLEALIDADLLVLPSVYEIFGIVLLEAYAFSKPVVASNLSSISSLVKDGDTGFLFTSGHLESLIENLRKILSDSERARTMGLNGRQFVEKNFTIDRTVRRIEETYETVLSNQEL
jgi:glycosyltransferase involved in cell wall biosynthesis